MPVWSFSHIWDTTEQIESETDTLGILAISGVELAAIFDLAQFCEHVLVKKPYPSNSEGEECRAHKKMYVLIARVKDHLWHADN